MVISESRKSAAQVPLRGALLCSQSSALLMFNITWQLHELFGISVYQPYISAPSILWTFIGLKFWVFANPSQSKRLAGVNKRCVHDRGTTTRSADTVYIVFVESAVCQS